MRRYWLTPDTEDFERLVIKGDSFHHIFEVCRNHIGSEFEILGLKPGIAVKVVVTEVSKKSATVKAITERVISSLPDPKIVLNLSLPKNPTLEAIVEKSVELGVHRIQLFTSEHSFIRSPKDFSGNKLERLNKIILHATQQTGRGDLMNLELPKPWPQLLENFVNRRDKIRGLLAYESLDSSQSLKTKLANLELASQQEVWLFVGSEGGFSSTEVSKAQDKGLEIVSLGSQILRVETACVVFIGSLKYELGLM